MIAHRHLFPIAIALLTVLGIATARADHELSLPPNELGKVMVLMYHHLEPKEATWTRTPQKFREDLELLYSKGYYLVNLADLLGGHLKVPKGKTPVVLTFDDFAPGQIVKKNGVWDPNCAVGIINEIHERHPDFGRAGSFYVNYRHDSKKDGPDSIASMFREMVDLGYEIGNHTLTHPKLNTLDRDSVVREIAGIQKWVGSMIPGYVIRTMAMPFGIYPKDTSWAVSGEYNGTEYRNEGLLMVGSAPASSPYSREFKPTRIERVRASELYDHPSEKGSLGYIRDAIAYFDEHPSRRFISDGEPDTITVPASRQNELSPNLKQRFQIRTQE